MRFNINSYSQLNANQSEWKNSNGFEQGVFRLVELRNENGTSQKFQFEDGYSFSGANTEGEFDRWVEILRDYVTDSNDFFEFMNFSFDNQPIGSSIYEKIYNDFQYHNDKVRDFVFSDKFKYRVHKGRWYGYFVNWLRAFELASDNGIILIHKHEEEKNHSSIEDLFCNLR